MAVSDTFAFLKIFNSLDCDYLIKQTCTCILSITFEMAPGSTRSISLHRTTPSLRDVFRNSSGSAIFFLGELSTPNVISHVTVCSSGFIVLGSMGLSDLAAPLVRQLSLFVLRCYPHPSRFCFFTDVTTTIQPGNLVLQWTSAI